MSSVTLSAGVRNNLLSLQKTSTLMGTTQNRLATGKKVNSALDNPTNFFTSSSLQSRGNDLSSLLDSMSNGIKTLEAADNGLTSITKTVESMQSTLRQARQDKSYKTASYEIDTSIALTSVNNLTISGGAVSGSQTVALNTQTVASATASTLAGTVAIANDAAAQSHTGTLTVTSTSGQTASITVTGTTLKTDVTTALTANGFTASYDGSNHLALTRADGANFTVSGTAAAGWGFAGAGATSTNGVEVATGAVKSVDALVSAINSNTSLNTAIRASNDNGKLRIENDSTSDLTVAGINATSGKADGSAGTATIGGNDVRKNLVSQFNSLRDQLDKLADDSSFNGINLLHADKLKITFNETSTSTIEIQAKDQTGTAREINSTKLGINVATNSQFDSDTTIDGLLSGLSDALNTLRSQSSAFGSNLSVVQNRQDFTKSMINTLQTGADNLTLADTNEEAANMLALQTRQQLSNTALSLASQADQAVLRLFG
jgi:flagellin